MTFDDQLRRAFDTLSDRLRDELERQVRAAMDELAASARDERDAAIATAHVDREAAVQSAEAAREAARSAEAERQRAIDAAKAERHAALESAHAEHDAAVRALEADRDAAVAAAQADRDAAVAAAQAEREAAAAVAASAAVAPPFAGADDVVAQLAAGVRAMSQASSLTAVLQALMTAAGASGAISNVWLVRGQELQPWRDDTSSTPLEPVALDAENPIADAARSKAAARRDEVVALPLTLAGEVVAILVTASPQLPAPNADALEVLALYASRALESITAFKTARALTRQPDRAGAAETHRDSTADNSADNGDGDISPEDMASAQRYAKLLVSEIKLYHEAEVVEGRRDGDLATRLGGEIARARVMYEQRVPAHVRRQADYFRDELVRTLANGDPALLEVRS
jgi:hypothetical protein